MTTEEEQKEVTLAQKKEVKEKGKEKGKEKEEELNEEDEKLRNELEMLVERLLENDESLYESALSQLKDFIRTSTSSMTAVPKPLKFLRPHYPALSSLYSKWPESKRPLLADVLSVLAMTYSDGGKRDCLRYRLLSFTDDVGSWGHEYVRHLALEVGEEYQKRAEEAAGEHDDGEKPRAAKHAEEAKKESGEPEYDADVPSIDTFPTSALIDLALKITPFFLQHNGEADAVDLLLEIEQIDKLLDVVDANTFQRVCLYMVSCVPLVPPPDDQKLLDIAYNLYLKNGQLTQAMALAIRIDNESYIGRVFDETDDEILKQQLAFIVSRQQIWMEVEDENVQNCLNNVSLSKYYLYLAKELNLLDPKVPDDIYKSRLETSRLGSNLDTAKQTLASSFVNAFVNLGFGADKLVSKADEKASWIYKAKGSGMASTTASIGSLYQWNFEEGLQQIDKYMYSSEEHIKAGALLGIGIVNAGVHSEADPAIALLGEYIDSASLPLRTSAIIGLGLSYAGSRREEIAELLLPLVTDPSLQMQIASLAALSLGHIFVGSANGDISSSILQTLLERKNHELGDKWTRFLALGLALLYMGKHEMIDAVVGTIRAIQHPIAQVIETLVTVCSYAGTGNVLQIQKLLQDCTTRADPDDEEESEGATGEGENPPVGENASTTQAAQEGDEATSANAENSGVATEETNDNSIVTTEEDVASVEDSNSRDYSVLGIAVVAMGEEIGQDMVLRHFGHLMHYGDQRIRRAVPLAMGLVSVSNPQMKIYDTLSRYSHDNDILVAINSIFSMGTVGAGTNNARIAQLLRQLAMYYSREPDSAFMVRIAQGLVHLGKGTLTINPFNTDRQILSRVSLAGLLTVSIALLDPKAFILGDAHDLLYFLTTAIRPRMLVTVDENLEPVKVNVRVGQAVDVVGQAGKPKTITGWVTQSTPVVLGYGDRAELEDDEYIPLSHSLEGIVILKKNSERMDLE